MIFKVTQLCHDLCGNTWEGSTYFIESNTIDPVLKVFSPLCFCPWIVTPLQTMTLDEAAKAEKKYNNANI